MAPNTQVQPDLKVHFDPDNFDIQVKKGDSLLEAARAAGVYLNASCGGAGVCGTCKMLVEKGEVQNFSTGVLSSQEYSRGIRQACRSRIVSDLSVRVLPESRLENVIAAGTEKKSAGVIATGWQYSPLIKKYYLQLAPPTIEDNTSDLSRLYRALETGFGLRNIHIDFSIVQKLPAVMRDRNWKITVTILTEKEYLDNNELETRIIDIAPGDNTGNNFSLAIDLGTTTVCGQLLDLRDGKVMAESMVFNRQGQYGADVISRINYSQKPGGLKTLREAVVSSINEVIDNLVTRTGIDKDDIGHINLAGNTVMTQILLELDPHNIRLAPYTPVANFIPPVKARSLGIQTAEHVYLSTFPLVSSYVGGDIVSGVVANGVYQRNKLTLYMDMGTNGEIVIGNSEWLLTASCSAGPAFEGGGIKHGMIAAPGAIEDFDIDAVTSEPVIHTIGGIKPKGVCGSGLINAIASLLLNGIIGQNGKFETAHSSPRVRHGEDGLEYVLVRATDTEIGRDIVLTEIDIDNFIRAKAAMYAGCQTLAESVQLNCSDLEQVILAGNFGNSVDIEKAIIIGLLPDIPRDRFFFVGNGSLSGARLVSCSADLLKDSIKVARMMTNFELSENRDFIDHYIAALFLPHTDMSSFPSVTAKVGIR